MKLQGRVDRWRGVAGAVGQLNQRRQLLRAAALGGLGSAPWVWVQAPAARREFFGPVQPALPVPGTRVRTHLGIATDLRTLLLGRVTALQLMFTHCGADCTIQGDTFAQTQGLLLGDAHMPMRWLSLSIDPRSDDPAALQRWLQRFGAGPDWIAASPHVDDLARLLDVLRGRSRGPDRHVGQVFFFDLQARLVYRSADLPSADQVVSLAREVAALR
jgi:protein SCO1